MAMEATAKGVDVAGAEVWERLWRKVPSADRDDALLARERSGPRWGAIVARLANAFGRIEGLRAIELGSGRGDLSVLLAERGARVTLLDASPTALHQARRRFERLGLTADFVEADMFDPPSDLRDRFDVALSSGVIEHFAGVQRTWAVGAHVGVLRPGGLAAISVPHAACPPYRMWKLYLELRGRWPYGFERPYGMREIRRRAREAGLECVEAEALALWHSLSAHWARGLFRLDVDWANRRSRLDRYWGLILMLFGRKAVGPVDKMGRASERMCKQP